jgi:hypothetical protein
MLYAPLISLMRAKCPANLILLFLITIKHKDKYRILHPPFEYFIW